MQRSDRHHRRVRFKSPISRRHQRSVSRSRSPSIRLSKDSDPSIAVISRIMQQHGEMLQQFSKIIDNIIAKPTTSAGLEDKSVVSSSLGDEQNQSPDRIQFHVGDDEKLDFDPEE